MGKTTLAHAMVHALVERGLRVAAVKPIETGVTGIPQDATALAVACGQPELANLPGFYRARAPLAPYAATLGGEAPCPLPWDPADTVRAHTESAQVVLVEGAGGPMVPLNEEEVVVDLSRELQAACILVAPNRLGCLSSVLTAAQSIKVRGAELRCVVLNRRVEDDGDPSRVSNARILRERLGCEVFDFDVKTPERDNENGENQSAKFWQCVLE